MQHISDATDFIKDIPLKHEIIIGADLNAAIGIFETSTLDNIMEDNEDTTNGLIVPHSTQNAMIQFTHQGTTM